MRVLALLLLSLAAVAHADVLIRSEVRPPELLAGSLAGAVSCAWSQEAHTRPSACPPAALPRKYQHDVFVSPRRSPATSRGCTRKRFTWWMTARRPAARTAVRP